MVIFSILSSSIVSMNDSSVYFTFIKVCGPSTVTVCCITQPCKALWISAGSNIICQVADGWRLSHQCEQTSPIQLNKLNEIIRKYYLMHNSEFKILYLFLMPYCHPSLLSLLDCLYIFFFPPFFSSLVTHISSSYVSPVICPLFPPLLFNVSILLFHHFILSSTLFSN